MLVAPLRLRVREGKFREPDLLVLLDARDPRRSNRYWTGADLVSGQTMRKLGFPNIGLWTRSERRCCSLSWKTEVIGKLAKLAVTPLWFPRLWMGCRYRWPNSSTRSSYWRGFLRTPWVKSTLSAHSGWSMKGLRLP